MPGVGSIDSRREKKQAKDEKYYQGKNLRLTKGREGGSWEKSGETKQRTSSEKNVRKEGEKQEPFGEMGMELVKGRGGIRGL